MPGEKYNLPYMVGNMGELAIDSLQDRVRFAADQDGPAEIAGPERLERGKQPAPAGFPPRHEILPGVFRAYHELRVPVAVRLFAVGSKEIRPARPHVARNVFHYGGDAVGF